MIIDICFACDENYAPYVACVLSSLLAVKEDEKYRVWIISDRISEQSKNWLKSVFSSLEMNFKEIPSHFLKRVPVRKKHLSRAAYARLAVGRVLPQEIKKVIYLDCDILILQSLKELWNWDLKKDILAGVEDWGVFFHKKEGKFCWPFEKSYKSSGLLLINLEEWRRKKCEEECLKYLREPRLPILHEDQDVLNFSLHSVFGEIPPEWNVVLNFSSEILERRCAPKEWINALKNPFVVHFATSDKPWLEGCLQPYREEFRKHMYQLGLPIKKFSVKLKLKRLLEYWKIHPIFFLKSSFWKKWKEQKWGVFR